MEISIFKFLLRYYGICLNAKANFSHEDAKENFPFLKTCSYKYARDNIDMVSLGKIIYVRDTNGLVIPYFAPSKVIDDIKYMDYYDSDNEDELLTELSISELSNIPTYMVRWLLSKYKGCYGYYRKIKKELEDRGVYDNKKYRINKEIDRLEESEYDDKYKRRRKIKRKKP